MLSKSSFEVYSSEPFAAGGYKWRLSIYPNGNKKRGGKDHISIYLELMDPSSLPADWVFNALVNSFVYNKPSKKYFGLQDLSISYNLFGSLLILFSLFLLELTVFVLIKCL
ncbi:hypothetical protein UlMin_044559 [Ulmus minor]